MYPTGNKRLLWQGIFAQKNSKWISFENMSDSIHDHKDFEALIKILGEEKGIEPGPVEMDSQSCN